MPGFDGTGPLGRGPRSGGGFGNCATSAGTGNNTGNTARGAGRGFPPWGGGRGRAWGGGRDGKCLGQHGFGWHGGFRSANDPGFSDQETALLKSRAESLEQELSALKARLDRIESEKQK